jgi:hypothetical protein
LYIKKSYLTIYFGKGVEPTKFPVNNCRKVF